MSPFAKAAALVLRIVGSVVALIGIIGPITAVLSRALGHEWPAYRTDQWLGSILWSLGGALLVGASRPLGRLLARGLE
jgi:hypothetical protein